jgi:LPPG:FO 2-phospho-L-lactate transferase
MIAASKPRVVALSGGVGGAKLALGLSRVLAPDALMVVANTGDDFSHLGLEISPDIDTLVYTLAGLNNPETGWGRRDETWTFMDALGRLGGETWFRLGDGDLAMHVERTRRLAAGETLSGITQSIARRLGVATRIVPMTDDPVRTKVHTGEGWLAFQDYFVRRRCAPAIRAIAFEGADAARPHPDFIAALRDERLDAVIICPSNPFISVEPILALPGVRAALAACAAPVIAVSPVIGGRAVKGPTAKMMAELEIAVNTVSVARRYADFLDAYVLDERDAGLAGQLGVATATTRTLMTTLQDREALARTALDLAHAVTSERGSRSRATA